MEPLQILQCNCRSLSANRESLEYLLTINNISIAILSETWLKPSSRFHLRNFRVYHADRLDGYGGAAILIHNRLPSSPLSSTLPTNVLNSIQLATAQVYMGNSKYVFGSLYLAPGSHLSEDTVASIITSLPQPMLLRGTVMQTLTCGDAVFKIHKA